MKTFRKIALMAIAVFIAAALPACDDEDDPVVNASLDGTWRVISASITGTKALEIIPDGFQKNPQTNTADETIYPGSLEFKTDGTGVYNFKVTEYTTDKNDDGSAKITAVRVDKSCTFTYTLSETTPATDVYNKLPQMTITYAASPYFQSGVETPSYEIKGDVLYLYQDFPRAADILRKE